MLGLCGGWGSGPARAHLQGKEGELRLHGVKVLTDVTLTLTLPKL